MDVETIERVYSVYSKFYDLLFGKIFHDSRATAIDLLNIKRGETVLEVGIGTGLCLPLYPRHCHVTGIELCASMLEKSRRRVERHELSHVTLKKMDAAAMEFDSDSFDVVMAAYTITTVQDPRKVITEMSRACKNGGRIVFLNHFRNGNKLLSHIERGIAPLCRAIGFRSDLDMEMLLKGTPLRVTKTFKVKPFNYFQIVQCINTKNGLK